MILESKLNPRSQKTAAVCLLGATACMLSLSFLSTEDAPAAVVHMQQEKPLPITESADTYPRWTHHYLIDSHFTVLDNGDDGALFAMMNADLLIHGRAEKAPLTSILEEGDIALDGAFENVGTTAVTIFTSDGEILKLPPTYRIVVSDKLLYGATQADRDTGQVAPNGCLCRCGTGWRERKSIGGANPPNCDGYIGLNCVDPRTHQLHQFDECVPGSVDESVAN